MRKALITITLCTLFIAGITLAQEPGGQPFKVLWNAITDLQDQINNIELTPGPEGPQGEPGPQGPPGEPSWDEGRVSSLEERANVVEEDLANYDYAFCQTCDESFPTPYSCTRKQAAEKCESLDMKLCSLAELNAHAEATGHRVCCWGWTGDPDYETWDRERGAVAHFMGSSIETDITSGCGGPPGGLRVGFRDHEGLASAHCCEK